ncbi:GDP-mannose mannosyl hydrolase [Shewanella pneumatophori]|uniref:GDP-mannose mannosyl hydrolase n=1 Tax=Shewanella pneumatophori TaxID=314092 RepID=A0A9X1ZGL3_9GAMM|nr:GDP-mannose mannosyl hydrolase [Shewanella pneumatophori]MCL1139575.1 GDP-mannose mannosyl hydrolase [Shewanella pneumatophori]
MSHLPQEDFKKVVKNTPLISIDLIIKNKLGQVLLGKRNNRPAQGYWFVPGGRIVKDETFDNAFSRLTLFELGKAYSLTSAMFLGPYEHLYCDCFSGDDFTTHYVVLAYELTLNEDLSGLPEEQHSDYRWWDVNKLLNSNIVHDNTKAYFLSSSNKTI